MAMRHYTDDVGHKGIEEIGMILPGRDGRVYVTPDEYESASEAERRLALPRRPTGYFLIPNDRLTSLSEVLVVQPHNDQPGGGHEHFVEHPVEVLDLTWEVLGP